MAKTMCCVCGEALDDFNWALCEGCGQRYHLNLRRDREAKDCGQVSVNEVFMVLEFACFKCLGRAGQAPPGGSH